MKEKIWFPEIGKFCWAYTFSGKVIRKKIGSFDVDESFNAPRSIVLFKSGDVAYRDCCFEHRYEALDIAQKTAFSDIFSSIEKYTSFYHDFLSAENSYFKKIEDRF